MFAEYNVELDVYVLNLKILICNKIKLIPIETLNILNI